MIKTTLFLFYLALLFPQPLFSAPLSFIRDTISTSAPSLPATHEIMFTTTTAIPSGGKIVIVPREAGLILPASLGFLDMDLAVATSSAYTDRPLAAAPSGADDGVSVTSGTAGSITFTLNGTTGINAGEKVKIEIGSNATFAATGANLIVNPTSPNSYRIDIVTKDASGAQIDFGTAMIAIIAQVTAGPVNTTIPTPPVISNGLPSGLLPSGTQAVELSVQTDTVATCKYSALPDIPFASSTGAFLSTGALVHSGAVISGLADGSAYTYYVRCRNYQLLATTTDYPIAFSIGVVPNTGSTSPVSYPPVSSGSIPGGGNFLKAADVTISGTAYPFSKIFILKDAKEAGSTLADALGTWSVKITGMERGTYTFGMYAVDSKNRRSVTVSSTVSLIAGTTNAVTRIFLPPTMSAEKTSVDPGGAFVLSGEGIPKSVIEVALSGQGGKSDPILPRTATTTALAGGSWSMTFDTKGLSGGAYEARVRSLLPDGGSSGFSAALSLGIGQEALPDLAARSDLNHDEKVNLIDFSILLFSWGTAETAADINGNGRVDLADFSILIFYWTG